VNWRREWKPLALLVGAFLVCFYLPMDSDRFRGALLESLHLAKWYAREHVLLCLVPAFFIAGAIGVFISQASVMRYLGARANQVLAYAVASVSGTILAVCSCTVLPLFAGIYRMGAGLGPACAFLYSGPAINVLAIVLTARILGLPLGIARAVGAIVFSVVIGLLMSLIFRREEAAKAQSQMQMPEPEAGRPLWQNAVYFALMVGILVFANWGRPNDYRLELADGTTLRAAVITESADACQLRVLDGEHAGDQIELAPAQIVRRDLVPGTWTSLWQAKWWITGVLAVALAVVLVLWFGIAWWKMLAIGIPPAILALALPNSGLWVTLPFAAGVIGLSVVLSTSEGEAGEWFGTSWTFAKQILPLLFGGVLVAGLLLGRIGHEGLIPSGWVASLVGGNSLWANLFAAVVGAFMYFATLTEVPILQGLIGNGMGQGPALALLLAGPALSLPNMLVIRSIMGTKKTVVFVLLVIVMATLSGMVFGVIAG